MGANPESIWQVLARRDTIMVLPMSFMPEESLE